MPVKASGQCGRIAAGNLATLLVAALLVCLFLLWVQPRGPIPGARFAAVKGDLVSVKVLARTVAAGTVTEELQLGNTHGLTLRALVQAPDTSGVRLPAFAIQAGYRTGRNSIRYLPRLRHPVVLLALDYPYALPATSEMIALIPEVPRILRASENTVAGLLLALDYLESRPDVDATRTVVVGGSLGGPFAVIAGAVEPRFEGVVLLYGGGDLDAILDTHLPIASRMARTAAIKALGPWVGRYDPLHYASRIAPRPFLMVNGRDDALIPESCVHALHAAAGEGKELVWLDTRHGIVRDRELLGQVGAVAFAWLEARGILGVPSPVSPGSPDYSVP